MFAISLNIDPEKLKETDKKNKSKKKGSKKTRKAKAGNNTASSKDADS
jgi:hypothetical protein